jgi:putative mycofactocin binding protein MftB
MIYRLSRGIRVRKEDWGLLFYSQAKNKIYFVKSGDCLRPLYSDKTLQSDFLYYDNDGTVTSSKTPERSVQKLITHLVERGIIVNEI